MNMNQKVWLFTVLMLAGGILAGAGFFVINESLERISGLCIGVGSGLFSMSLANIIILRFYENHPERKKQAVIDSRDERSIAIRTRAKAKAFDRMIAVMLLFPFLLILKGIAMWVVLSCVGLYVIGYGLQIFYTIKFSKQM